MGSYVPLHVHSQYSILDSTVSFAKLMQKAKGYGVSSLALTDKGNLFGAVEFFKLAKKEKIKPILGCELWVAPESRHKKRKEPGIPVGFPVLFFAMNDIGYHNLCKLSSLGYLEGFYYYPRIDKELLEKHQEGLLCLTGSMLSPFSYFIRRNKEELFEKELDWYRSLFQDRLYLQIQRASFETEQFSKESWLLQKAQEYIADSRKVEKTLVSFAKKENLPLVACNEIHYLEKEDWKAHEILLNVSSAETVEIWERDSKGNIKNKVPNPKRKTLASREFYFKSPEEMEALFSDLPEALKNTQEVEKRCQLEIDFQTKHYPVFLPPSLVNKEYTKEEKEKETANYLYKLCKEGFSKRYTEEHLKKVQEKYPGKDPKKIVEERLELEFSIISSKGMCDYLLIVYDFIFWAKNNKIPVGPGRGSAAGSIIAYLLGITDIEPLRFHLFFERFINPERISYPDIDVDICMERRSEVIEYTIRKYGKEKVAQIITFGKMKAKMAIKDVGRVLNVSLAKVNQIAKLVPDDLNITLEKALEMDPELKSFYEKDEETRRVIDMAKKTEGSIRNTSTHAAGLIISEKAIMEHIPVCTSKDADMIVTQYAMKPVEAVGMLKIDFLGLKTLSCIQKCVSEVQKRKQIEIDISNLPLDDKKTFALLREGKTLGVFQVESSGMQDLLVNLKIDSFEEIIAVGALYRPGPMDMIPSFINRKHKKEEIHIDHPWMKEILEETYGVMVYQEQVMQIANKLAGYSLGEGDVLRKAMGKKDREEMVRQRKKFILGCKERQIEEKTAEHIFEKIEKFASYGFNKSHAAAYAYLTYITAYLKANYPGEWMAALMTCDVHDLSKIAKFIREAQGLQIAILSPDINESGKDFVSTEKGIRFAMAGIKGVGISVVEAILEERGKRGFFSSLEDFIHRIDSSKVGKKSIEILIMAGSFDFTGWNRDETYLYLEENYERVIQDKKEKEKGVLSFFSLLEEKVDKPILPPKVKEESSPISVLHKERELIGFYLTSHPLSLYKQKIADLDCSSLKDLEKKKNQWLKIAFILEEVQFKISAKSQKKFAILTISDGLEKYEVPLFSEVYDRSLPFLQENQILVGLFCLEEKDQKRRLSCRFLHDLQEVDVEELEEERKKLISFQKGYQKKMKQEEKKEEKLLQVFLNLREIRFSDIMKMKELFRKYAGKTPLKLQFEERETVVASLYIQPTWGVDLNQEFLYALKSFPHLIRYELTSI